MIARSAKGWETSAGRKGDGGDDKAFDRSIIRLGVLLLLFDVYLTWARIEKSSTLASTPLSTAPIIVQYLFFLTLNASATLAHHLVVRLGASIISKRSQQASSLAAGADANETPSTPTVATSFISASANVSRSPSSLDMQGLHPSASASAYSTGSASTSSYGASYWPPDPSSPPPPPPPGQQGQQGLQTQLRRVSTSPAQFQPLPPPSPPSANAVSTALFVSSCPKLFPILMVIWGSKEVPVPEGGSSMADSPAVTMLHKTFATATATVSSAVSVPSVSAVLAQTDTAITTTGTTASSASFFSPFGNPFASLATLTSAFNLPSLMSFLSLGTASTHLVLLNNIEALYILLDCGYLRAVALAVAGQLARWVVEKLVLGVFGIY
ncbi:Arv1 protein [Penicillium occitanis (nom. inval.)]|nr:Arv1 protein [Penicillium occitanis (nom. inval.)]PCG94892.1 hypothetical protein PENOC_080450 [Penicillium occitanis (nom. inval.)]